MKKGTILTKVGRNTKRDKGYINPPIYKGSKIVFDAFRKYLNDRDNNIRCFFHTTTIHIIFYGR